MVKQSESKFADKVLKHLRKIPSSWWMKTHGSAMQVRGTPDIIGSIKGQFWAFELKIGDRLVTGLQEYTLAQIKRAGGKAEVLRDWQKMPFEEG